MATNTAASFTNHTGNGTAGPFNISFSYLSEAEVDVTVGGVLKTITTHYTFTSATQITFTSGNEPANGVAIKFQRDTNISAKKVDFADGSVLTEADLDANSDQVLFAQQEIIDKLGGIEEGATGDQTNAEIRAAVEAASDSNVFTDADHSKLNAIEASATADQTAAEIRTLVESASDSNVFTDADHTKLNGIEASATADQTAAEIRTLVESASDSNVFTDADHTKLNGIETGATADQTVSEIKSLIAGSPLDATHLAANSVDSSELVDGSVDTSHLSADCVDATKIADNAIGSEHLQANSVTTSEIADAELTTLAGMQSGTASKLADSTALTSDIADLNQLDGMAKQTTITDDDTKFPTSGAVVDFVAAQIAPIGGLEVIANEDSFPTTQPSSGVVISISDIEGLIVNGSGVATNARTTGNGSDNVTINGFPSSLQSKTMAAGLGLMVSSTGSSQTYTYHKLLAKEADVEQLSNDINDFAARYRVGSSNPTTDLDAGDLFFNTSTQKLLVYNSTNSAWEEAQSIGNFFISTFSESFDGSRTDFTVSNAPANAQQIILSINGVVQKPNSGTSTPSEGFALSGSTVKLSSAPASGSDVFIIVMGSTVNIGTPSNNTVTSAILQNGSVIESKLADSAITNAKVNASAAIAGTKISPNFGSQAITTTGNLNAKDIILTDTDPSITFTDSDDNPDYRIFASAGRFKLKDATNNVDRVTLDSSGNVGIGTTSPTFSSFGSNTGGIEISDVGSSANALLVQSSSNEFFFANTSSANYIYGADNVPLIIGTNASERMRIDTSGNVGIGTSSPDKILHIKTAVVNTAQLVVESTATDSYPLLKLKNDAREYQLTCHGGLSDAFTIYDGTSNAHRFTIDSSGNVGIGTTSPSDKLHVHGGAGSPPKIIISEGGAQSAIRATRNADTNSDLRFQTEIGGSLADRMLINYSGNVGIGTTSPNETLTIINSASHSTSPCYIKANGSNNIRVLGLQSLRAATSGGIAGSFIEFFKANGSAIGSVTGENSISYNTTSDYRLKENVVAISDAITRLKTLKPSRFNWIANPSTTVDGFLAHEVTAVPEAITGTKDQVATSDDVNDEIKEGDPIYQSIDQSKLVPLLTAALQEAIAKIETLETKVAALGG